MRDEIGEMSTDSEELRRIRALEERFLHYERGKGRFDDDEVELIRSALKSYEGLMALGRAVRFVVIGLAVVAGAVAAGDTLLERFRQWVAGG